MVNEITFKHSGNAGDIIAAMAGIKAVCDGIGAKARLLLRLDVPAFYYHGAPKHPVQDRTGVEVMLSRKQYDMLKPLLLAQEYVASVDIYTGQKVIIDLDKIRGEINVGMPHTQIQHWYGFAFPDMFADLSEQWMWPGGNGYGDAKHVERDILVNRTSRYVNEHLDFHFLQAYQDRLMFTGLPGERDIFCERWNLDIPLLEVKDFAELADCLNNAQLVLCNQSFVYNLCEAMKVPRLLEVCPWAANCTPVGPGSAAYMHQGGLEHWFNKMVL